MTSPAIDTGKVKPLQGVVVSDKMEKGFVVLVERRVKHPRYHKFITKSKKYHVHDEQNNACVGDTVTFKSCRPRSATKRWILVDVVERSVI